MLWENLDDVWLGSSSRGHAGGRSAARESCVWRLELSTLRPPAGRRRGESMGTGRLARMPQVQAHDETAVRTGVTPAAGGALILGGGLRIAALMRQLRLPLLCLPQDERRSVLDTWTEALARVGVPRERVWVMADAETAGHWRGRDDAPMVFEDRASYRGPAGVLRDASQNLGSDAPRIVLEHTRLLEDPSLLPDVVEAHAGAGTGVTLAINPDGSFSGILVADVEAINLIPSIGFMDIKEQWLPAAQANGFRVSMVRLGGWSRQIKGLSGYLSALASIGAFGPSTDGSRVIGRGLDHLEPTSYRRSLVCEGASLGAGAVTARSVIGPGARVGDGAIVIRSVVAPGVEVASGAHLVDSVVDAAGTTVADRVSGK